MICPKCSSETKVVNSRPHKDDATVIQRRRHCEICGHKFNTWESSVDVVERRQREAARSAQRRARAPEAMRSQDRAYNHRRNLRRAAHAEAAETGRPLAEICRQWGIG